MSGRDNDGICTFLGFAGVGQSRDDWKKGERGGASRSEEARKQVAVRRVKLDHVEASADGHLEGGDELVADLVHL